MLDGRWIKQEAKDEPEVKEQKWAHWGQSIWIWIIVWW